MLTTKVEPIDRDVRLIIDEMLSPQARSAMFAADAKMFLDDADNTNKAILGRIPRNHTFVDGRDGARLESVKPDGVVVREYELVIDLLRWIADDLVAHSPIGRTSAGDKHPGLYKASHTLFADEKEIPVGAEIPQADEYVFTNIVAYARKIEGGSSRQFDHVYEGTASRARARFGNVARILFTYRGLIGRSSGSGSLINPLNDPTRGGPRVRVGGAGKDRGRFAASGSKAYNVSSVRFPVITVRMG